MDLSNPLAAITPTLDARVLQVLATTTAGCTAAEVHRRLGRGSDEGVRKVLGRLAGQGVVDVETVARSSLYRLNRRHLAADHIIGLTLLRDELVRRLSNQLMGWEVAALHAGLFGSFARGEADAESDVDVLLVRPRQLADDDDETWLAQVDTLDRSIVAWTGNDAHVVDLTPGTLRRMVLDGDPLVDSWRADDVHLVGERISELMGRSR